MTKFSRINNLLDGFGQSIGYTLDKTGVIGPAYRYFSGELTSASPQVIFDFTDPNVMGTMGSVLTIVNMNLLLNPSGTQTDNFTLSFSVNGTDWGDEIPVYSILIRSFEKWQVFKKVRLTRNGSDVPYEVTVV